MAFGLSFGKKKQSSSETSAFNKDESTIGTQTTGTASSGTTSTSQTGTQTNQAAGTSATSNTTNQQQSGSQTGSTSSTSKSISDTVRGGLEAAISGLLGSFQSSGGQQSQQNILDSIDDFNADRFVSDTVMAASNRGERELQEQSAAQQNAIGGTAGTNSMAALLAQRGSQDLAATLAGVRADATAKAAGIGQGNLSAVSSANAQGAGALASLVESLKGAETTTDQTSLVSTLESLLGQQAGRTDTTEASTQQTAQQTTQTQFLQELVQQLINQNVVSSGTANTQTKGKTSGGGFSLSV